MPDDPAASLTVVEFQFQQDDSIYRRTVMEMVSVQEEFPHRPVQGVIFFRYNSLDPRTSPWTEVVHSFLLRDVLEALEQREPEHPLVAVFKPVLLSNPRTLERQAVDHYRRIKNSALDSRAKSALLEVFVSWVEQRLIDKGKEEIEAMFLGELTPLEETQSGKDLIRIGEERGREQGLEQGLEKAAIVFLKAKHGRIPKKLITDIESLTAAQAERLVAHLPKCGTLDDVRAWLKAARQ